MKEDGTYSTDVLEHGSITGGGTITDLDERLRLLVPEVIDSSPGTFDFLL